MQASEAETHALEPELEQRRPTACTAWHEIGWWLGCGSPSLLQCLQPSSGYVLMTQKTLCAATWVKQQQQQQQRGRLTQSWRQLRR